jgi:hypothetical protein
MRLTPRVGFFFEFIELILTTLVMLTIYFILMMFFLTVPREWLLHKLSLVISGEAAMPYWNTENGRTLIEHFSFVLDDLVDRIKQLRYGTNMQETIKCFSYPDYVWYVQEMGGEIKVLGYSVMFSLGWLWLYYVSRLVLTMVMTLLRPARGFLDVEKKPLQSIGLVAGFIVFSIDLFS